VYRAIVERQQQARLRRRKAAAASGAGSGRGILGFLLGRQRRLPRDTTTTGLGAGEGRGVTTESTSSKDANADTDITIPTMAQSGLAGSSGSGSTSSIWGAGEDGAANANGASKERGSRRRKVYAYLKAANELRQAYSAQWAQRNNSQWDYDSDGSGMPGGFPDVEIARSGDEEMVLFPSYARRHTGRRHETDIIRRQQAEDSGDMDFWREEWESYDDDTAIVDVDVRGWIYTPHRGPMSRKQRILITLARKLSGIPAPSVSAADGRESRPAERTRTSSEKQDEEAVNNEVQSILNKAESEADVAWREGASGGNREERASSGNLSRATAQSASSMTKDELTTANANLMERLRPFLTNPLVGIPITVFFFNDKQSQSRHIRTNESGHFSLRASLPFVPTQIRVLASENLSATRDVEIIEPKGISLISDIDDTVKHSAITAGAKEIFRNTFVRDLSDLTIKGVREWYSKMASMGVKMHYVSNSPWQLYPLLETYFKLAGLPPGSIHLKHYSGMLQGIFEPTAERKRGSLERIMQDFPERKFILVGDSGEADLEVYTELALANPGRVLGIFIRDVTTPEQKRFFDKSVDHLEDASSRNHSPSRSVDSSDAVDKRPPLPPRKPVERSPAPEARSSDSADLIDLRDSDDQSKDTLDTAKSVSRPPPVKPSKPAALSTASTETVNPSKVHDKDGSSTQNYVIPRKPAPPLPSKPRRLSSPNERPLPDQPPPLPARPSQHVQPSDPSIIASRGANGSAEGQTSVKTEQPEQHQVQGYAATVRNVVANTYNNLPSIRNYLNTTPSISSASTTGSESSGAQPPRSKQPPPPPPPPRRSNTVAAASAASSNPPRPGQLQKQQSFPVSALKLSASTPSLGRTNTSTASSASDHNPVLPSNSSSSTLATEPLPNKREEMWRRRWERAKEILDQHGVVLGNWRVGGDIQDVCVWLVEEAKREMCQDQETGVERRRG